MYSFYRFCTLCISYIEHMLVFELLWNPIFFSLFHAAFSFEYIWSWYIMFIDTQLWSISIAMIEFKPQALWVHSFAKSAGKLSIFLLTSTPCFQMSAPPTDTSTGFPTEFLLIFGSKGVLTLFFLDYLLSRWQQFLTTQWLVLVY